MTPSVAGLSRSLVGELPLGNAHAGLLSLAPDAPQCRCMRPAQARNRAGTCNRKSERSRRLPPRRICCGDRTTTSARASRPFAYQNRYTITSADYGPFTAPCDARLRRLIREIGAIAQLQAMQETDAFKKAALEAGKSPFRAARSLIDDPVGTLSAIPEGISSIFDRASEQIRRSGRSRYEDGAAKSLLAVSATSGNSPRNSAWTTIPATRPCRRN